MLTISLTHAHTFFYILHINFFILTGHRYCLKYQIESECEYVCLFLYQKHMDNFQMHMTSGTQLYYINCTRVTLIIFFYYLELRRVRLQTYFLIKYTFF